VRFGGKPASVFIKENEDRIASLHLKDGKVKATDHCVSIDWYKKPEFTERGRGVVDFPSIMEAIKSLDLEWLVVQQDTSDLEPKKSMAINREYLRSKFKP
jgi:sugar phosphate isomerase/epimerase